MLMPFGLEILGFWPAEIGLRFMLWVSEEIVALPKANLLLPPISDWGLLLVAVGLLWVCLWQRRWRWIGVMPMLVGMASMLLYVAPDILISDDGKQVAVRMPDARWVMLKGGVDNHVTRQWAQALGIEGFSRRRDEPATEALRCDDSGCLYMGSNTRTMLYAMREAALEGEGCRWNNLTLADFPLSGYPSCEDGIVLAERKLPQAVYFSGDEVRVVDTRAERGDRPWVK